ARARLCGEGGRGLRARRTPGPLGGRAQEHRRRHAPPPRRAAGGRPAPRAARSDHDARIARARARRGASAAMRLFDRLRDPARTAARRERMRRGDRGQVARAEAWIREDPSRLTFDAEGAARFTLDGRTYDAGRFSTPSIAELRARAPLAAAPAPIALGVLLG